MKTLFYWQMKTFVLLHNFYSCTNEPALGEFLLPGGQGRPAYEAVDMCGLRLSPHMKLDGSSSSLLPVATPTEVALPCPLPSI